MSRGYPYAPDQQRWSPVHVQVQVDCWSSLCWSSIHPQDQQCRLPLHWMPLCWSLIHPQDQQCRSPLRWLPLRRLSIHPPTNFDFLIFNIRIYFFAIQLWKGPHIVGTFIKLYKIGTESDPSDFAQRYSLIWCTSSFVALYESLVANPCFAWNVWGHRSLMVVDKVYMESHKTSWNTMFLVNPSGLFKHTARADGSVTLLKATYSWPWGVNQQCRPGVDQQSTLLR